MTKDLELDPSLELKIVKTLSLWLSLYRRFTERGNDEKKTQNKCLEAQKHQGPALWARSV